MVPLVNPDPLDLWVRLDLRDHEENQAHKDNRDSEEKQACRDHVESQVWLDLAAHWALQDHQALLVQLDSVVRPDNVVTPDLLVKLV